VVFHVFYGHRIRYKFATFYQLQLVQDRGNCPLFIPKMICNNSGNRNVSTGYKNH